MLIRLENHLDKEDDWGMAFPCGCFPLYRPGPGTGNVQDGWLAGESGELHGEGVS